MLAARGPRRYEEIWPEVLQRRHITKADLNGIVASMKRAGHVEITGMKARQQVPYDENVIGLLQPRSRP
jgi:hypothetical protein